MEDGEEKVEERIFFKIATGKDTGENILLIDDLARIALGAIERGRTSFEKEKRLPEVTRILKDILPGPIRGIIKKTTTGVKQLSNGYVPVPVKITRTNIAGYGPSTRISSIKITDRGINLLKKIKENPSNYEALGGNFIQFLVSLYKNKDNANITPEKLASQIGISSIAASRFANNMAKNNIADLDKSTKQFKDTYEWYIYNPGAPSEEPSDIKGVGTKLYENIKSIVEKELLNEVTYSKFKNEVKFRTKSEQLHKAIREVKRKLQEIDRIVEYTSRMKQELSENGGVSYWKATQKNIGSISEMVNQLNNKIKNLHQ
jgi:predicted transcriptional regulator